MDEPLSNLDAKLRVQTRSEIKRIQAQIGTATVYVIHDQVEAMTMGDRVAVMSEGVLEQAGDPRTVYDEPANVFVAGFIGSPSMSFATVNAERRDGSLVLSRGGFVLTIDEQQAPGRVPAEVIAGVRPEHTRLWHDGAGLVGAIEGRAEYVEMLGLERSSGSQRPGRSGSRCMPSPMPPSARARQSGSGWSEGACTCSTSTLNRRSRASRSSIAAAELPLIDPADSTA